MGIEKLSIDEFRSSTHPTKRDRTLDGEEALAKEIQDPWDHVNLPKKIQNKVRKGKPIYVFSKFTSFTTSASSRERIIVC